MVGTDASHVYGSGFYSRKDMGYTALRPAFQSLLENSGTVLQIRPRPLLSAFCTILHAIIRYYRTLATVNVVN